jgi:hypothetical protein
MNRELPEWPAEAIRSIKAPTLVHRADWLVSMVGEFLDAPMPEAG